MRQDFGKGKISGGSGPGDNDYDYGTREDMRQDEDDDDVDMRGWGQWDNYQYAPEVGKKYDTLGASYDNKYSKIIPEP